MHTRTNSEPPKHIGVVGLGFVGLPLAIEFWKAGLEVSGVDADEQKIASLQRGQSYVSPIPERVISDLSRSQRFRCSTDISKLVEADAIVICVPTPITSDGAPDLTYVLQSSRAVASILNRGQLVVLESSTFPGTTEHHVKKILESSGLHAGRDFHLAYSPERINPGDEWELCDIPKVIGGTDHDSLNAALALYGLIFKHLVPVSSTTVAEFTKLLENTQRFVVISLMNELAVLCNECNIDLWEAIEAAQTKPYGFVPAYPGPGVGGHCIPVDPLYLDWYATQSHHAVKFVKLAKEINDGMPLYITERIIKLANTSAADQKRVLLLGLAYKPNVNDTRDSANLIIFRELVHRGVEVQYYDPFVPFVRVADTVYASLASLPPEVLRSFDVVAVLTNHASVDYDTILKSATRILDTRNQYQHVSSSKVVPL